MFEPKQSVFWRKMFILCRIYAAVEGKANIKTTQVAEREISSFMLSYMYIHLVFKQVRNSDGQWLLSF